MFLHGMVGKNCKEKLTMIIKRNIKGEEVELELTQDELYEASREVKINFYLGELQASFPPDKRKRQNGRCSRCLLEILQN